MNAKRFLRHLAVPRWWTLRVFPKADREAIGEAVAASETRHRGELRFAFEGPLPLRHLWRDASARQRAEELFVKLGVAATAEQSGILIYVQLVDRRVEILADRGIAAGVPQARWDAICREMETAFAAGRWYDGAVAAVVSASALLIEHFPAGTRNPNELPDEPAVL